MTTGTIRPIRIEDEMRSSYLDYAMSVIVSRALPDVRDGLKPVQRRILYAMDELGMRPGTPYKKSARLVGEVLGKYHPHGDAPVYDAMVRLAQDFTMRYPLIDGQGNFGSIDDDPPAAMRYTEARLASIAQEMLIDLDRETVGFTPNFDGSLPEPAVLPARLPNLLVNGSSGIAVGMTTSIPPHNLGEVCDAIVHLIQHPQATVEDLLQFVHGPDFPTGALILGREGILETYELGHGRVVVRAKVDVEEMGRGGRFQLVVTEIPYLVNKATLVEKIAHLAKEKKIDGITEVRDESDRHGLRVVVELRRDAQVDRVKNNLFKHTTLQSAFYINLLALVNGQPRTLSLQSILHHYIEFRVEVIRRRTEYDIRKAQARLHILEGLRIAINHLDAVIQLIRNSPDTETARQRLMEQYALDDEQARAILDMQLRRLAALERQRIEDEYNELTRTVADLQALLADPARVLAVVAEETQRLKEQYGDPRRTAVVEESPTDFTKEQLIPHQDLVVTLSQRGYIKCIPTTTYRLQHRGGRGVKGQTTREGDELLHILVADNHDLLLFFTNQGRVYGIKAYEVPTDISRATRGKHLIEALPLKPEESVQTLLAVPSLQENRDLILATRAGEVKRMGLSRLANLRLSGLTAMDLEKDDELVSVRLAREDDEIIMVSELGNSIRFPVAKLPLRSRAAGGVRGMRLRQQGDHVVAMDIVAQDGQLLVISQKGRGKPTALASYRQQSRGGYGTKTFRITTESGTVAAAKVVHEGEEIIIVSQKALVTRTSLTELRELSRRTQGVWIVKQLPKDDQVVSIATLDPQGRAARDTRGSLQVHEPRLPVPAPGEGPSTNGHQEGDEPL